MKSNVTIEDIRKINGMENLTNEELQKIIESIREFTLLLKMIPSVDHKSIK